MSDNIRKYDMTTGPEWKHILVFSLPIMAGNLLQQLYNTVDGIVVGNFVSQDALAAAGTAGTLALVFLAFAIGFGNGCGILISQLFGAKKMEELRSAVSTSLILLTGIGLLFSVLACVFARFLLAGLMRVEAGDVLEYAVTYFAIYAVGLVLQFLYNAVTCILRSLGDSRATLYFLLICSVANLVLDLVFVICFHWGIAGAAIATVISQLASAVASIVYMVKKYPLFRYKRSEFVFDRQQCLLCLKLSIPSTLQQSIVSFGNVFIQRLVNSFGAATMAAFTVGSRIENYLFVTAVGFNQSMATFAGQNMGARRHDRVRRGVRHALIMSLAVSAFLELLSYVFASPIASLFGVSGEALELSIQYVRFLSLFFWTFSLYMVFMGTLQGCGDVFFTSFCSLLALSIRVGVSYAFNAWFHTGCSIIWKAMPVGWGASLLVSVIHFLRGKWKTKGVVSREATE